MTRTSSEKWGLNVPRSAKCTLTSLFLDRNTEDVAERNASRPAALSAISEIEMKHTTLGGPCKPPAHDTHAHTQRMEAQHVELQLHQISPTTGPRKATTATLNHLTPYGYH